MDVNKQSSKALVDVSPFTNKSVVLFQGIKKERMIMVFVFSECVLTPSF